MTTSIIQGLQYVKLPVSDLDASLGWYGRVLGAEHQEQFDYVDEEGYRYAVITTVPGLGVPLELRWAPASAESMRGYDPISFAGGSADDLQAWAEHLDAEGVEHSPITVGGVPGICSCSPILT